MEEILKFWKTDHPSIFWLSIYENSKGLFQAGALGAVWIQIINGHSVYFFLNSQDASKVRYKTSEQLFWIAKRFNTQG